MRQPPVLRKGPLFLLRARRRTNLIQAASFSNLHTVKRIALALVGGLVLVCAFAAQAQISTNATNSVVRFRIGYGSQLLGDIDVELFDLDKPLTVSNFLAYVQRGVFPNTLLHRCAPGFVLQGGGWTIPAPTSTEFFTRAIGIRAGTPVTNEFAVGTTRSNVFGTLGMARPPGQPNGATTHWYFNLGDNSDGTGSTNLNTADGGYVVFGQIKTGGAVLQFFNSLSENDGLLNMTDGIYQTFCSPVVLDPGGAGFHFDSLPVSITNRFQCPRYSELLTVQIIFLSGQDALPPTVAVTSPVRNASLTAENILLRGTVTDNATVASVRIFWGTNSPLDAMITNQNWSITLTNVPPGTNTVLVEAADTSGLRAQVTHSFFRSVRVPITLHVSGHGRIAGATDQQLLEVGRGYTITATPERGNLFVHWTGSVFGAAAKLPFQMGSNFTITAVFVTNLFPNVKGVYTGLFYNTNLVEQESSGLLTLKLGNAGDYSGKILMNGKSHSLRGVFSSDGRETNFVTRTGTNALLLELALDLTNGTDRLSGFITNNQLTAVDTNHGWWAELIADRPVFNARMSPAPQAGKYTLLIPTDTNSVTGPPADGYGIVAVAPAGAISFAGALPDGTKVSQRVSLAKSGEWPLYVPLYKDKGALLGWITITNQAASDFAGRLNWFKQSQPKARYYPGGFTNETMVIGSRFLPASMSNRVINLTNAIVGFTNENLAVNFTNGVILSADGKAAIQGTNKLKFSVAKSSGLFSGSVVPPETKKAIKFNGVVLQNQNLGSGFFLGTNQSGSVSLRP